MLLLRLHGAEAVQPFCNSLRLFKSRGSPSLLKLAVPSLLALEDAKLALHPVVPSSLRIYQLVLLLYNVFRNLEGRVCPKTSSQDLSRKPLRKTAAFWAFD